MAYNNKKKDKHRQNKKNEIFRDIFVSQPKKHKLCNKNSKQSQIYRFPTLCIFFSMFSLNWICQYCDNSTRKQNELLKNAIMLKNKKK